MKERAAVMASPAADEPGAGDELSAVTGGSTARERVAVRSSAGMRPLRVLAVDDSAVMRGVLRSLFLQHAERPRPGIPRIELCGVLEDGEAGIAAVPRLRPDVVVLDLEMPGMNGLDVLGRLRIEQPGLPVIMCSSHTERGARSTLDALAHGAADYVMKPAGQQDFAMAIETLAAQLLPRIAALAGAGHLALSALRGDAVRAEMAGRDGTEGRLGSSPFEAAPFEIVLIGVSTGGPSALEAMLPGLPEGFPVPVLIVQHMPKLFTGALAARLDRCCKLPVREGFDGAELRPGAVWLAPGDAHMEVDESGGAGGGRSGSFSGPLSGPLSADRRVAGEGRPTVLRLHQQPALNQCKPSVDYLFSSAARIYGAETLALVMTGMGSDGLAGARRVHQAGGTVLAQDRASSAVWGMPGRVVEAGLVREPLPLSALAGELTRRVLLGRRRHGPPAKAGSEPGEGRSGPVRRAEGNTYGARTADGALRREGTHGLL